MQPGAMGSPKSKSKASGRICASVHTSHFLSAAVHRHVLHGIATAFKTASVLLRAAMLSSTSLGTTEALQAAGMQPARGLVVSASTPKAPATPQGHPPR